MKQYNLGPNGGILTSLNLFSTKIDQVMSILEKRCLTPKPEAQQQQQTDPATPPRPQHILIDTPGQIEVFVWSASGSILLSSLATSFPTVLAYIIDTPRSTSNTATFMSNMLYAISILYKTKLPMILVFNKTDVKSEEGAVEWMRDFEAFQAALREEEEEGGGSGYMNSLLNSMSLVLEEFYNALSVVGVSSMTGDGVEAFFAAVGAKREEFEREYRPEMEKRVREAARQKTILREREVERMMGDMGVSSRKKGTGKYARRAEEEAETVSEAEEMEMEMQREEERGLVDPDSEGDDEEGEDAGFDEDGLKARYRRALRDSGGGGADAGGRSAGNVGAGAGGGVGKAAEYIMRSQR